MSNVDDGLRALWRKHLPPPVHWTSVETGMVQRGVPDLHGTLQGCSRWIECKAVRRGWAVKFQPGQVAWHWACARHGGSSVVAVRRRTAVADELWLIAGWAARELQAHGLPPGHAPGSLPLRIKGRVLPSGALLGAWAGGPARWPWPLLRTLLVAHQPPPALG